MTAPLSRGILAIIIFVTALIVTLSFFGNAGLAGEIIDQQILGPLFGTIKYSVPVVLLLFSWFVVADSTDEYHSTHWLGAILFFVTAASLMNLSFPLEDMWTMALEGHGGGVLGMPAYLTKQYLGTIAGGIIFIALLLISILLLFNTTVAHFIVLHRRLFEGLGAMGKGLLSFFQTIFVPAKADKTFAKKTVRTYEDEQDEESDYDEEEEEESYDEDEVLDEDDDEAYDEELEDEEVAKAPPKRVAPKVITPDETKVDPSADPSWMQNVIVKDLPPLSLLQDKKGKPSSGDIRRNAELIVDTLAEFNIDVEVEEVRTGPTVTQFALRPAKGVKISRITALSNDLALALAAHPIRIEAPIPGKSLIGIEVPNQKTAMVAFKELLQSGEFKGRKHNMSIGLGKDVGGKVWFADLPRMPHLLIAGTTGSGKTVCMNTIILSMLYQNTAEDLRMIMVDPKRVELTLYNGIPHLLTPVITNPQKTINALKWAIGEMDRRFEVLSQAGNREIATYNQSHPDKKMPHIVFIIDELADLMAVAANDVESGIIRLAQMARAVGIHLIVATQRPSVDVITGLMKANIPARIAFSVASVTDSRTILDSPGAEKLIGRGDMLFQTAELSKPVRIQGAFVSEEEMKGVIEYLKGDEPPSYDDSIVEKQSSSGSTANMFGGPDDDRDALFNDAKQAIVEAGKASASFLQRKLKVGYARAARILDELEEAGIVGPADGAKPRDILVTEVELEDDEEETAAKLNAYHQAPTADESDDDVEAEIDDAIEEDDDYEDEEEEEYEDDDIDDEDDEQEEEDDDDSSFIH